MSLFEKIKEDIKTALKAKEGFRLNVLRMLSSSLGNREIEKHAQCVQAGKPPEPLTDDEGVGVLQKEYKQRKESALAYEQGGRVDLQESELKEAEIIAEYLPQMLSEEEIKMRAQSVIASLGVSGASGVGAVMKTLSPELKGKAEMSVVSRVVKELLGS